MKSPFWSRQPVFHYHYFHYWLFPPGILQYTFKINKYFDGNIEFKSYNNLENKKKALMCSLLRSHYSPKQHEKFNPPNEGILNYSNCLVGLMC